MDLVVRLLANILGQWGFGRHGKIQCEFQVEKLQLKVKAGLHKFARQKAFIIETYWRGP